MKAREIVMSVGLGMLVLTPPAASANEGLFRDAGPAPRRDEAPHAEQDGRPGWILRSRPVRVERSLLPRASGPTLLPPNGQRLRLNLFDDTTVDVRITRAERQARGTAWIGRVEGVPLSSVVMVDRDGILAGSIVSPQAMYKIRWDGTGQVIEEIDRSQLSEDECFAEVPPGSTAPDHATSQDVVTAGDDGSTIDVLVAYTPAARAAAGGTAGMLAEVQLAITETNTGYADSGVVQRLRLAGTAEVSYTETSSSMSTDLNRLTSSSDGYIDDVHALRDAHKADLVALIGAGYSGGACGIAWVGSNSASFASHAFSVTNLSCMTGYYSFGHELGHNMGLLHDRATSGCPSGDCGAGAYSYSFGYRDPAGAFRTVLAYNCPGGCPRVLHYSNPGVSHAGKPTGVVASSSASAHNALSLNNTRVTVSNWRAGGNSGLPFGTVDTPAEGAGGLAGSVAVTGWALDDVEVAKVDIWRDPVGGEATAPNGKVFLGDATFVRGARPDVEAAHPGYPYRDRAGWGHLILSNFLPSGGNGTYTLYAYAHDSGGQSVLLGARTIGVDNASATTPFGTLDTPGPGETISGSAYVVWGWALTPVPAAVPVDGSTIWVVVDGVPLGHPVYDTYREDIANGFPGYANSGGAVGHFVLDTTTLTNGIHEVSWSVTDDLGRTQGLGSRYFWVGN